MPQNYQQHGRQPQAQNQNLGGRGQQGHPAQFLNPYHFVPTSGAVTKRSSIEGFPTNALTHVTHDRYVADTRSGRITCTLGTVTPCVFGGEQSKQTNQPTLVHPFERAGQPAVSSSTLRGLISSLAEAASNSALRVLSDELYSYREPMENALSAIGMIIEKNGRFELRPLTLPHLIPDRGYHLDNALPDPAQASKSSGKFTRRMYPRPVLKVLIGDSREIRSGQFFDDFNTFSADPPAAFAASPKFWGLKLPPLPNYDPGSGRVQVTDPHTTERGDILIGQIQCTTINHHGEKDWPAPVEWRADLETQGFTRGILRILGVNEAWARQIPGDTRGKYGKKHEVFIPCPMSLGDPAEATNSNYTSADLSIEPIALERFRALCDQRSDDENKDTDPPYQELPYHPYGTKRCSGGTNSLGAPPKGAPKKPFRIKHGDLVYFRPNENGNAVAEISLSAIWRGRVETLVNHQLTQAKAPDFFASIDPNLVPLGLRSGRTHLTLAEELFGVVSQEKGQKSLALAGRVKFSDALPVWPPGKEYSRNDWYLPRQTLKILATPKPPSPALYFKQRDGGFIQKTRLDPQKHQPQGRKVYLHHAADHPAHQDQRPDWQSRRAADPQTAEQKCSVEPLMPDKTFSFTVTFENLTNHELGCLLYSLQPAPAFHHKLGLGKPLGLGTVKCAIEKVEILTRHTRYAEDDVFSTVRFHETWTPATDVFAKLHQEFRDGMNPAVRDAIETLGDPAKVTHPVHYPQVATIPDADLELESYRWFVVNQQKWKDQNRQTQLPKKKMMPPVGGGQLPPLPRHPPPFIQH